MLHILLVAAGAWRNTPERALYEAYRARMSWKLELLEIDIKSKGDTHKDRMQEGAKMQEAAERFHAHRRVALDERGKNLASRAFAETLGRWQDAGENRIVFFIGGHHGLDEALRRQAQLTISFGEMTWPHLLVRPLLAEQLYRAQSILAGHPYHRD